MKKSSTVEFRLPAIHAFLFFWVQNCFSSTNTHRSFMSREASLSRVLLPFIRLPLVEWKGIRYFSTGTGTRHIQILPAVESGEKRTLGKQTIESRYHLSLSFILKAFTSCSSSQKKVKNKTSCNRSQFISLSRPVHRHSFSSHRISKRKESDEKSYLALLFYPSSFLSMKKGGMMARQRKIWHGKLLG